MNKYFIVAACVIGFALGALLSGCDGAPAPATPLLPNPVIASAPTAPPNLNATSTRVTNTRTPITVTSAITLTVWTTESFAPNTTPAGRAWRSQLDAFSLENPNIHIETVLKKASGKGGLLDFLLTTQAIVPAQLPDVITLDLVDVPLAAEQGALQSLDGVLATELQNDFFPFALRAAHDQNQWIAVPFVTDVQHLVYFKNVVRKVPTTWDEVLKQKATLLLPLGGDDPFLLQYLAVAPDNALAQGTLDQTATAQTLSFIKRAHDQALLPEIAIGLKNVDEAWTSFVAGQAAMAQVSASRYLSERDKYPNVLYAPVPTRDGKTLTLASGWAFGMVTNDPTRQNAAARFIQWMVQSDHLAPWLRVTHRLPANRATLALTIDSPEYATFLRDELEHAVRVPTTPASSKITDAWRIALSAVWKGQATPEDAARTAASTSK